MGAAPDMTPEVERTRKSPGTYRVVHISEFLGKTALHPRESSRTATTTTSSTLTSLSALDVVEMKNIASTPSLRLSCNVDFGHLDNPDLIGSC